MQTTPDISELYRTVRETPDYAPMHDEAIRAVYETVLSTGDVAVDAGAHAGKHAIPMAVAVGPSGRVYAFEPLEEGRLRLLRAIQELGLSNILVSSHAVSDSTGLEVTFLYFPERPGISGFRRREAVEELQAEERTAVTTTLDESLSDLSPRFLKIDVEGAEMLVLRGGRSVIDRARPVIAVEAGIVSWRPFGFAAEDLHLWCAQHSYDCYDLVGNTLPTARDIEASFSTPGVWDYILVPREDAGRVVADVLLDYRARYLSA